MSDEKIDAIERALALKPGDKFEGATLLRKDVSNGHFVWWLDSGGCVSLNNLIASMRPDKTGPRAEVARLRGALERALSVVASVAAWDLFGDHGNLVNGARYAEEAARAALASPPLVPAGEPRARECTCLGSCKGPEGLAPGWRCALGRVVEPTPEVRRG